MTPRKRFEGWRGWRNATVALSLVAALGGCRASRESERATTPVILISIDTLRADRLPMYGYAGVRTPNLDALRGDAILYQNAYTHVPLTLPAHAALFTGTLPYENGVRNNLGFRLRDDIETLPQLLRANGYATGGAVSAYVLRAATGISRGFDAYDDAISVGGGEAFGQLQRRGDETADIALRWIEQQRHAPFFSFLHIFEPHSPYEPPASFAHFANPYDGEVAAADAIVGRFVSRLKELDLYDRSLIIVLSDHGEGLGDHGEEEHGIFLYREATRVPLIVKLPGGERRGESVSAPVQLIDIFPTICDVLGLDAPKLSGTSTVGELPPERRIYAESLYGRLHLGWSELRSLITSDHQYIEAPEPELYDLRSDPAQRRNILADARRVYAALRSELVRVPRGDVDAAAIAPDEAKKLTALGYLGATTAAGGDSKLDPKRQIGDIAAMRTAAREAAAGHLERAIALYQKILERNPRFADAWNALADAHERRGAYRDAIAARRKAIDASPSLAADAYLTLSHAHLQLGELEQAEEFARLAVERTPGAAKLQLARIAFMRGDAASAERVATEARIDSNTALAAEVLIAQLLGATGREAEALARVAAAERDASKRGVRPPESLELARGDALARLDRTEEAKAAFRREIAAYPRNHHAYLRLLIVLLLEGNGAEGERVARQLSEVRPDLRPKVLEALRDLGASDAAARLD